MNRMKCMGKTIQPVEEILHRGESGMGVVNVC